MPSSLSFLSLYPIDTIKLTFLTEKKHFHRSPRFDPFLDSANLSRAKRGDIKHAPCETNTRRYFFLSTTRAAAIWRRPICRGGGGGDRPTSGRLFGDRERHYHEYKHPTTAILMVARRRAVPLPRISRPLQHPPCPCQEERIHLPSPPPSSFFHRSVPSILRRSFTRFAANKNSHESRDGAGWL